MAEGSGHIGERVNIINVFHGVNLKRKLSWVIQGNHHLTQRRGFTRMLLMVFVVKTYSC